jgi:hypothetical protein
MARYLLLDHRAQEFYADWETVARDYAAALRIEAGRDPYNRRLTDLSRVKVVCQPFKTAGCVFDLCVYVPHARSPPLIDERVELRAGHLADFGKPALSRCPTQPPRTAPQSVRD